MRAPGEKTVVEEVERCGWAHFRLQSEEHFDECIRSFGELIPQQAGVKVYDVAVEPGYENMRFSKSANPIGPHTEFPYFDTPPRYLALLCRRPATCGGGATLLANFHSLAMQLSPAEIEEMRAITVDFHSAVFSNGHHAASGRHPVLSGRGKREYLIRYSHNLFFFGDTDATQDGNFADVAETLIARHPVLGRIATLFDQTAARFDLQVGDCLIWNNHRVLHAREAFKDHRRWLRRYVVQ